MRHVGGRRSSRRSGTQRGVTRRWLLALIPLLVAMSSCTGGVTESDEYWRYERISTETPANSSTRPPNE